MENSVKSTPKDVFLQLFNIVTFYLSMIGFIILYVQYVNALFPDKLNYYFTAISDLVRVASSILFIAIPAYIISAWFLSKDIAVMPEKRELKLRKWLTYFTLFISAVTIIVDLMIFVYNFLNGEISVRFVLKVLVVLLVACGVFGYYMWDLKRKDLQSKLPKILAIVLAVFALVSIIIGFFIVGTPVDQRNRRFDEQRVQELQMIQGQVVNYWTLKKSLPADLSLLQDNISGFMVPSDPDTKVGYEYKILDPLKFELCATFARPNNELDFRFKEAPQYAMPNDSFQQNWNHEAGRTCFTRTIDPELYKLPNNKD